MKKCGHKNSKVKIRPIALKAISFDVIQNLLCCFALKEYETVQKIFNGFDFRPDFFNFMNFS